MPLLTLQAVPVKWMCWDLSQYLRTSFLPGCNNLLIKSWANVPGRESRLCCAKNRESVPELGTFSHPVDSKTHQLQLQKPFESSKVWKSALLWSAVLSLLSQWRSRTQRTLTIPSSGGPATPEAPGKKFASSGAYCCALKKVVRRRLSARYLVGEGLYLHYCCHEGSSDFPVICNNLVVPRVSSCREGISWLFHPKCCVCLSSANSPRRIVRLSPD